jgi:hypothetical protein
MTMGERPPGISERDVEELRQLAAFFDESISEASANVPDVVTSVMKIKTAELLPALTVAVPLTEAVTTIAAFAYLAGRKAERAGLLHEGP